MMVIASIQVLPLTDKSRFAGAFISRPVAGRLT